MKKYLSSCAALLALTLPCGAMAQTANASVVAPYTQAVTAPFAGTLLPFDLQTGDAVNADDALFAYSTTPVYAAQSGTVAAVFAQAGDDVTGVAAHYGALAIIEPEHALYLAASTDQAYDNDDNRYIHAGETLYLKNGDEKGTGIVTAVSGKQYTVEILTGDFDLNDTVRCFRERAMPSDSETGRGKVTRYADAQVNLPNGRITAVHVQAGDKVSVGDLLFEVIDAVSLKEASAQIAAPISGAVTKLAAVSGAQVYRGQLLCEIADLSRLELRIDVDELDLTSAKLGDTLSYTLDAYAGETFFGQVTKINPIGTPRQNATYFDVRLTLPEGRMLLPGMNATVTLDK